MIYHLKSSKKDTRGRKVALQSLALLFFVLLFTYSDTLRHSSASLLQSVGVPIWQSENYIYNSQSGFFAYFRSKKNLVLQNQNLQIRNQALEADNLKTAILQSENESLKNSLDRSNIAPRVLASVLVWPSKSLYDSLVIDAGTDHAITAGDFVTVGDISIGKVSEVYPHTAKVILFSSGGEKLDVLLNPSHLPLTAYGRGGGNFEAQVPRSVAVLIGDTLTLPGTSIAIFGSVEDIVEKPTDTFKTILFKIPVNYL